MAFTAKFMAFYLLLGSFLPQSDFSQLLKLSMLVEHYDLHVEQATAVGEDFSFQEYLCIHFIHPDQHEHGDNSHQDLPLQTLNSSITMLPIQANLTLTRPSQQQQTAIFTPSAWISHNYLGMLLRPPIS